VNYLPTSVFIQKHEHVLHLLLILFRLHVCMYKYGDKTL
jgi:hypothetical protein